jgi:hypothetical protein
MRGRFDDRDIGEPARKAWEEFRASYSAALLNVWLLEDLEYICPNYFEELETRVAEGILSGEQLMKDDPEAFPEAPIQGPEGHGVAFWPLDDAYLLEQQLFPHNSSQDDYKLMARGLAAVGLHAALAAYFGLVPGKTDKSLPESMRLWHKRTLAKSLEAELSDTLIELDETRNIVVHNRGIVSEKYANNVPLNKLQLGERKPIGFRDLQRFANTVWELADKLHAAGISKG